MKNHIYILCYKSNTISRDSAIFTHEQFANNVIKYVQKAHQKFSWFIKNSNKKSKSDIVD